jgi:subtilisin family serine protease
MFKKYFIISIIATLVVSLITYQKVQSYSVTYDVRPATGPVVFRILLNDANTRINSKYAYDNNYQGQDTYVAVIDTGVQSDHPFLGGRVELEACFATSCPNGSTQMIGKGASAPVHWHGTHVAGIVAGQNNAYRGVAPKTKIIAVNVFNSTGAAYDADIIKALRWIESLSSTYNIASVNMSLGTQQLFNSTCDSYLPEMTDAISDLRDKNIATVVAAGNNYSYGMNSPACITHSVSVAATYSSTDQVTDFSNLTERTTLSAPGSAIYSSSTAGSYRTASGTSMAAPMVAGAYAVYRSKYGVASVSKVTEDYRSTSSPALDVATRIYTKRIDLKSLFEAPVPETTTTTSTTTSTTVVSTTTTAPTTTSTVAPTTSTTSTTSTSTTSTVPVVTTTSTLPTTTTTTTVVIEDEEEDEAQLNTPYVLLLKKFNSSLFRLTFVYRYTDVPVKGYILQCKYSNGVTIHRTIRDRDTEYNRYLINATTATLSRCKIAAVSTSGLIGKYTRNIRLR